jgi:DNA polymerase
MLRSMGLWVPPALSPGQPTALAPARPAAQPPAPPPAAREPIAVAPDILREEPAARGAAAPAAPAIPSATAVASAPGQAAAVIAKLDWPALRQAVADCRACTLCSSRKQTVFGVGHPSAHWMLVGEAPGAQEDEQGEPFVGAAGQLLDAMLRALRLTREEEGDPARRIYIANTLKCRPPGNRNPQPEELARCEPFLLRQLELVRPKIILAMGRFAVQSLLRSSEAIGKLRGRVHRYQGVPLVVTYHPAYLLRNLPDKARTWEDLCLAAAEMERIAPLPASATPATAAAPASDPAH